MSKWTHIVAAIYVDMMNEDAAALSKIVEQLPPITGSEQNADIFINKLSGYNFYTNEGSYQTCGVITIVGDLRDRNKEQTEKEYNDFIKQLNKKTMIIYQVSNIIGGN